MTHVTSLKIRHLSKHMISVDPDCCRQNGLYELCSIHTLLPQTVNANGSKNSCPHCRNGVTTNTRVQSI